MGAYSTSQLRLTTMIEYDIWNIFSSSLALYKAFNTFEYTTLDSENIIEDKFTIMGFWGFGFWSFGLMSTELQLSFEYIFSTHNNFNEATTTGVLVMCRGIFEV